MECIDVLDKNGNKTGGIKTKPEIHRDGDWHKAVHVWIINSKQELLIQRRSPRKDTYPNMWDIPSAGHVSAGENGIITAIRETEEELGLKLKEEDFEFLFTVAQKVVLHNETYFNNEFNDVYLVKLDINPAKLQLQKEEVAEVKFIHFKELEKSISENPEQFVSHPNEEKQLFAELHKRYS